MSVRRWTWHTKLPQATALVLACSCALAAASAPAKVGVFGDGSVAAPAFLGWGW